MVLVKNMFKSMVLSLMMLIPLMLFGTSPWPMFHQNPQRTGLSPYIGPETPDTLWTLQVVDLFVPCGHPVIGENGTIYIGVTGSSVDESGFFAIDPSGYIKWSLPQITGGNGLGYGCHGIGSDGTIYVYGDSLWAIEDSATYGKIKWSIPNLTSGPGTISPTLVGNDGTIYIMDGGYLKAISPEGTVMWCKQYPCENPGPGAVLSPGGDTLYIPSLRDASSIMMTAIDPNTGEKLWWVYLDVAPNRLSESTPTVGSDGTIYYTLNFPVEIIAINPSGDILWRTEIPNGHNFWASPIIGPDGTIYQTAAFYAVPVYADTLFAFNPDDGSRKWACGLPGDPFISSPAVDANGTIYVSVSSDDSNKVNAVCAINPDGTEKWVCSMEIEGYPWASPAIGADGTIYAMTTYGKLYAIGPGVGVKEQTNNITPQHIAYLLQISPNPFRNKVDITFSIGQRAESIELKIYDVSGRVVRTLVTGDLRSGVHTVCWDGTDEIGNEVQNGVYFCRLSVGNYRSTKKLLLLR